jgi:hypothetical protein
MMGSNPSAPAQVKSNAGLYVLAARDIFRLLEIKSNTAHTTRSSESFQVMVSCFEIYGGKLFDLLNDRGVIRCLEDSKQQVQLPGLTQHLIQNVDELLCMMSRAHEQRSTGSTGANLESSRSHQVLQLSLQQSTLGKNNKPTSFKKYGQLSFIDLAGSERGADTTNNSKQTRMEGAEINTSLLALKEVIRSLEKKHGHTPFRGSKLTQVLKDSFIGEKTRTCMVACVSPNMSNCEHTLNTLRYADRVKEHQSSSQGPLQPPVPTRSKSESLDLHHHHHSQHHSHHHNQSYDEGPPPHRGNNQRPVTASTSSNARDDHLLQARPSTAYPTGPGDKETNRRGSLDRGYYQQPASAPAANYPPPQSLNRAMSIGATAMRRGQPLAPAAAQYDDNDYQDMSSHHSAPRPSRDLSRQLSTPIQNQGKRIEASGPPVRAAVAATGPGIRLLRGGNNSVASAAISSRDHDYDPVNLTRPTVHYSPCLLMVSRIRTRV